MGACPVGSAPCVHAPARAAERPLPPQQHTQHAQHALWKWKNTAGAACTHLAIQSSSLWTCTHKAGRRGGGGEGGGIRGVLPQRAASALNHGALLPAARARARARAPPPPPPPPAAAQRAARLKVVGQAAAAHEDVEEQEAPGAQPDGNAAEQLRVVLHVLPMRQGRGGRMGGDTRRNKGLKRGRRRSRGSRAEPVLWGPRGRRGMQRRGGTSAQDRCCLRPHSTPTAHLEAFDRHHPVVAARFRGLEHKQIGGDDLQVLQAALPVAAGQGRAGRGRAGPPEEGSGSEKSLGGRGFGQHCQWLWQPRCNEISGGR